MSGDETVRDRVARTLRDARNVPGVGDPSPWANAVPAARGAYLREADALLAAFPELGLFERLEGETRGFAAYRREEDGAWRARVSNEARGTGESPAAALSAALDQVKTQERER